MPSTRFQDLAAPAAPRFLQIGVHSPGIALECNRSSAGSGNFLVDQHIIGLSIGAPHKSEFAIESDRVERLKFQSGDLQIIPADHHHRASWEPCDFVLLFLSRDLMDVIARDLDYNGRLSLSRPQLKVRDPTIEAALLALRDESLAGCMLGSLYTDSLVTVIGTRILRNQSGRRERPVGSDFKSLSDFRLIFDYIEHHLDQRLTLAELGSMLGMGPGRFGKAFTQAVGVPPHRFVLQRRLERAKQLLSETNLSITEVALAAGFNSHSHLSEVFRRTVNFTPHQFRLGSRK